jgi:pyruvate/2-oxoglutarate dehydrogenase complex dihydrolipoamide acyltransferase (E2) component
MPISVTITANDVGELRGWARLLAGMDPGEVGGVVEVTAAAAGILQKAVVENSTETAAEKAAGGGRRGRPPKDAPKTPEPAQAAPETPEAPIEGEVLPPAGPELTHDVLREELKRISASHGLEASRKLLAAMGVARLGDVEPAKFAEFMAKAKDWTASS